jgi:transcriptional regulator with XRE-family HTH domain
LERIRQRYKFGTAELAELVGSSMSALRSWENGTRRPAIPARRLILLVEQALEQMPAGKWRETVWGGGLAGIIAIRKGEVDDTLKRIEEQRGEA